MKKLNKNTTLATTLGRQQDDIYTYLTHPNQKRAQEEQINRCLKSSRPKTSTVPRRCLSRGALILLIVNIVLVRQIGAQFLFTYEINNESDDSRAPKSSLFDPSSFKIVTPSQLQSSYQKLSAQPPEQAPNAPQSAIPAPVTSTASLGVQPASTQAPSSASFLKQTSAALQSFAELFSLAPSSSPSPLSPTLTHHQVAASSPPVSHLDQQAEAKSLHEHWTQQQQKAHLANQQQQQQQQQPAQTAFQSFTTQSSLGPQQQQSASPATPSNQPAPPGSYWLTANPLSGPDGSFLVEIKTPHQQQPSSSSSSSSSSSASSQQSTSSLVESLLALGEPDTTPPVSPTPSRLGGQQFASPATSAPLSNPRQSFRPFTTSSSSGQASTPSTSAQSSFLATPTSYYPNPSQLAASPTPSTPLVAPPTNSLETNSLRSPANSQPAPTLASFTPQSQPNLGQHQHNNHHLQQSQPLHSHQARSLINNQQQQQSQRPQFNRPQQDDEQLQPPANAPENFLTSVNNQPPVARVQPVVLKSAEESLISFRQQQDRQHEQQNSLIAAQQQLAQRQRQQQQQQQERHNHHHPESVATGNELNSDHPHHNQHHARNQHVALGASNEQEHQPLVRQQLQPPANQPPVQTAPQRPQQPSLGEIPKVSPQIYESFLLQQKDQHEKHMELLKQQQELNKLLEQKQKQQEAAEQQKRKQRKKDDLEKQELRRKEAAEAAEKGRARKARLEAEEARRKQLRRKQEEEERRRKAAEEERKYRELLEAREREEKRQRELAAAEEAERQREAEAAAAAAAAAAEKKRQQQAAEEAAKYKNYLRQQEELKKLLELKQREDEAAQARQKAAAEAAREQATSANEQTSSSPRATRLNQASRANKLAQEHKQRTSSWGAPIRGSRVGLTGSLSNDNSQPIESSTLVNNYELSTPTIRATTATTTTTTSLAPTTSTTPAPRGSSLRHSQVQRTRLGNNKKRTDEKLIRDKIPLYSGAGKYGLYRSGNESLDLAALLDSVTLPSSTTTTTTTTSTTTTTTTTPAPASDLIETDDLTSTSLSPLLAASHSRQATPAPSVASSRSPNEPAFDDDDVPRRPSRTLVQVAVARPPVLPTPQSLTRNVANPARLDTPAAPANQTHGARTAHIGLASLPADSDNDGIPGRAGVEYPVLSAVPPTSFSCSKQPLNGYYADTETACQVVHLCQGGVQSSILCPNGTIFNQEKFSCQWWYEVNCSRAPMFYQLNDNLYKALPGSTGDINKLATTTNNAKRTRTSGV